MSALPLTLAVHQIAERTNASQPRQPLREHTNATEPRRTLRVIERYHLLGKVGDGYELVQPLPVDVQREHDGTYLISDPFFGVYGHGANEDDAFADVSLVEYHDIMAAGVNPETRAVVEHLRTYLQPER
jgi:hypothetical protein